MKKALPFFVGSIICLFVAIRYFQPDFSWFTLALDDEASSNMAEMNQPFPHAVMPSVDGNWVDFENYKGKVVLINFFTTWCSGCRDEMHELIKLQKEFRSEGFTVVAVAVDDQGEESVDAFVKTERFTVDGTSAAIDFPVLMGHDELSRKMGFEGGLPASVLVTREGQEVKIIRGPLHIKEVSKAIKRLL
jgi:thiol-disulfide isomerase/thioredoxin